MILMPSVTSVLISIMIFKLFVVTSITRMKTVLSPKHTDPHPSPKNKTVGSQSLSTPEGTLKTENQWMSEIKIQINH